MIDPMQGLIDPGDITGTLGVREWQFAVDIGRLTSTARHTIWKSAIMQAHEPPTDNNSSGIYAHGLECMAGGIWLGPSYAGGIVELRGVTKRHSDGTLRGTWCRILELVVTQLNFDRQVRAKTRRGKTTTEYIPHNITNYAAQFLADFYRVPVTVVPSTQDWFRLLLAVNRYGIYDRMLQDIAKSAGMCNVRIPIDYLMKVGKPLVLPNVYEQKGGE